MTADVHTEAAVEDGLADLNAGGNEGDDADAEKV
jgi:hypothetical protein